MEKDKILGSLRRYFKSKKADYAVMITGEWGIGKTYFLKHEVYPLLNQLALIPFYVSLIGYNNETQLEDSVFKQINPFYKPENKSILAKEADHIESIIKGTPNLNLPIPDNVVLCFDDLERIRPEFFKTAMGFINVFIEHYKTKCIFLCNEKRIEEENDIQNYKTIKEKYIRFTYLYSPIIEDVLAAEVSAIDSFYKSYYDEETILEMFRRGGTNNLRTLFFALSIFDLWLREFDELQDTLAHKDEIVKLALTYCCFYSIESKGVETYDLLDKITIARSAPQIVLPNLDQLGKPGTPNGKEDTELELNSKNEIERIQSIQVKYFKDYTIDFERFESIAGLIKNGYIDTEILKNELTALNEALKRKKQNGEVEKLVHMLDNVFTYSDDELLQKIAIVKEEVRKGTLNLVDYLKLYQTLVSLESLGLRGVDVNDEVTQNFKEGVEAARRVGKLKYIPNFNIQFGWNKKDESDYAKKYSDFATFVFSINDNLHAFQNSKNFKDVITAIQDGRDTELLNLLSPDLGLKLEKEDAKRIYDALIRAKAGTTNRFYGALEVRYNFDGRSYNYNVENEKEFISSLYNYLIDNDSLKIGIKRTLNEVQLMFLKDFLYKIYDFYFHENGEV